MSNPRERNLADTQWDAPGCAQEAPGASPQARVDPKTPAQRCRGWNAYKPNPLGARVACRCWASPGSDYCHYHQPPQEPRQELQPPQEPLPQEPLRGSEALIEGEPEAQPKAPLSERDERVGVGVGVGARVRRPVLGTARSTTSAKCGVLRRGRTRTIALAVLRALLSSSILRLDILTPPEAAAKPERGSESPMRGEPQALRGYGDERVGEHKTSGREAVEETGSRSQQEGEEEDVS